MPSNIRVTVWNEYRHERNFEHAVDTDVVLIVTNLSSHVAFALFALERGKHVLMEKPFAQTLVEAWKVVSAAERQERVFMISQTYRYFPAARAVAELVQRGTRVAQLPITPERLFLAMQ